MSVATLPPTQVPTLTEVVEWPPVLSLDDELLLPSLPADPGVANTAEATTADTDSAHAASADICTTPASPADDVEFDVDVDVDASAEPVAAEPAEVAPPQADALAVAAEPPPAIDEAALTQRVLVDLQQQLDTLLEQQLRATMQPLLNQLFDTLAQQSRDELASALRDMVAQAVSREMARLQVPAPHDDPA